jgi:hypothetical protein
VSVDPRVGDDVAEADSEVVALGSAVVGGGLLGLDGGAELGGGLLGGFDGDDLLDVGAGVGMG